MKNRERNDKQRFRAAAIGALAAIVSFAIPAAAQIKRELQTFPTSAGAVAITPVYHASALIEAGGKAIYIDPARPGDLSGLPSANLILITSATAEHADPVTIAALRRTDTDIWGPQPISKSIGHAQIILNGETKQWHGWSIHAIAAYMVHKNGPKKGQANGYVLGYGGKRFYFSGDSEGVPEMLALKNIDVAFVCMSDTTMTAREAAAAVQTFRPKIVIPYAYRGTDLNIFQERLEGYSVVRLLNWYPHSTAR